MSKQLQYELWRECNTRCTFCTLGLDVLKTPEDLKLKSMQFAIDEIKTLEAGKYDTLGFIGGEFFQGQLNTDALLLKFKELMLVSREALSKGIFKNFWLNASLILGKQEVLYETLDLFEGYENIWVLTSYDTVGRFRTKKHFEDWEDNIKKLNSNYSWVNLNITSILSGYFIQRYLNNTFNIVEFCSKYNSTFFLKNPVKPDHFKEMKKIDINRKIGYFFPRREEFLEFLFKFKNNEGLDVYNNLMSTSLRASEVRKNHNTEDGYRNAKFIRESSTDSEYLYDDSDNLVQTVSDCGHLDIYESYFDTDDCMLCDKKMILEL